MTPLSRDFFARNTLAVARDLLGRHLVRDLDGARIVGRIVEAEAYMGFEDRASHGARARTARTEVMFGPVGVSYVYFTYGMHWMLNVVARPDSEDYPAAVLLRALEPLAGLEHIAERRAGRPPLEWTSGPAKLTKALGIDKTLSGLNMTAPGGPIYFEAGEPMPDSEVATGPRVGMGQTPEPWFSMPWRFYVQDNPYVSRYR